MINDVDDDLYEQW